MNLFEKIIYSLNLQMETPITFGWFHLLCIIITILSIIILYIYKNKYDEKQLKLVLGIYGIGTLILEVLKQLMWSMNYNAETLMVTWDYNWYAAPFQLCTTPMYVAIICLFLKKNKIRDSLLSYLSYFTILGSIATIIMPDSCFTSDVLINIHTMYLHCGSLVLSVYLLFTKEVKINYKAFLYGYVVFLIFAFIANTMNISFYNLGIIGNETFNMFYISPYFISILPVFSTIQQSIPYFFFLIIYLIAIYLGGNIILLVSYCINNIIKKEHI